MPSMNGYEFIKQVKKIKPQVNVILMTAFQIEDKEFHRILPSIKKWFSSKEHHGKALEIERFWPLSTSRAITSDGSSIQ